MNGLGLTTVCGTCGGVMYVDEAASHKCNPRRVSELARQVADLTAQVTVLSQRLSDAERAFALAAGIMQGRQMVTPGRPELHLVSPNRAARPAQQVTRKGGPGRAATKRTAGRSSQVPVVLPSRRAPAEGGAA